MEEVVDFVDSVVRLNEEQLQKLYSPYIAHGRKQESWAFTEVLISEGGARASGSMVHCYASRTDPLGFHLPVFTALEMCSQLMIVFAHHWAGLEEKCMEGWLIESTISSTAAIRAQKEIQVDMTVEKIRRRDNKILFLAKFRLADTFGGHMSLRCKSFFN